MHIDLSGRAVLVTGGARGIGAAISRRFAKAGAKVVVHYGQGAERAQALAQEIGGGALALGADLADPRAAAGLWARATAAAIPGSELLVIDGVGHELPEAVWPAVLDRIAELVLRAEPPRSVG